MIRSRDERTNRYPISVVWPIRSVVCHEVIGLQGRITSGKLADSLGSDAVLDCLCRTYFTIIKEIVSNKRRDSDLEGLGEALPHLSTCVMFSKKHIFLSSRLAKLVSYI